MSTSRPELKMGVQFHLPTYSHVPLPHLIQLAEQAVDQGISQIWITDNLRSRNTFVTLSALACHVPANLGTAVTVQYFRNPVDLADMVASISELMDGRELSIGLGRGNPRTPSLIKTPKPVTTLRETAQSLRRLLEGDSVGFADYPNILSYFNFNPTAHFKLNFSPKAPIRIYCGSNGPLGMAVGGKEMDGLIFGGHYMAALRTGRVPGLLQIFDDAANEAGKTSTSKVAEIKISLSRNRHAARDFVKENAGRRILNMYRQGYSHQDIQKLGVNLEDMARLDQVEAEGGAFDRLVSDQMIDAIFIAGETGECLERLLEVRDIAQAQGFHQLMFSELGPDVDEALGLLCHEILPNL